MADKRVIHDVAFSTSRHILEVFVGCLREEEQRDAFTEIYARVKAGLESFELQSARMKQRLTPSDN